MKHFVIHKFVIDTNRVIFDLPLSSSIVHVGKDSRSKLPALWIWLDPEEKDTKPRAFEIFATGEEIPYSNCVYVGTVHIDEYIWHICEMT